jgi:hypothetical protein
MGMDKSTGTSVGGRSLSTTIDTLDLSDDDDSASVGGLRPLTSAASALSASVSAAAVAAASAAAAAATEGAALPLPLNLTPEEHEYVAGLRAKLEQQRKTRSLFRSP